MGNDQAKQQIRAALEGKLNNPSQMDEIVDQVAKAASGGNDPAAGTQAQEGQSGQSGQSGTSKR
jgi:hypothetical protein